MCFFIVGLNFAIYKTFLTHNFTISISRNDWPANNNLKTTLKKLKTLSINNHINLKLYIVPYFVHVCTLSTIT